MIQLRKNYSLPEREEEFVPIKIVSIGGAGLSVLDRIILDGLERADVVAINTDVQSLASSVAPHKVQLGRMATRGLGTGGDPELGYQAAGESAEEIRAALAPALRHMSRSLPVKPVRLLSRLPLFHLVSKANAAAHKRRRHSVGSTRSPTQSFAS